MLIRVEETKKIQFTYHQNSILEKPFSTDQYSNKMINAAFKVNKSEDDVNDNRSNGFETSSSLNKQWQSLQIICPEEVPIPQVEPMMMSPSGMRTMGMNQTNLGRNHFSPQVYKTAPIYTNPPLNDYFPYEIESDEFATVSNYNRIANTTMCNYSNSSIYPAMMNTMQYNPSNAMLSPSRPNKVVRSTIPIDGYIYQV